MNLRSSHGFLLAGSSGALLALSFPKYGHPALAWIALVPLLIAVSGWAPRTGAGGGAAGAAFPGQPPGRAFALGLLAGVIYFVGTIYWTGTVLSAFGGLAPPLAILAMLLLAAYLALFPALTSLVAARAVRRMGVIGLYVVPAAWVATEFLRGWLLGGFPWVPLGNTQVTVLPVAQLASVLGVYGLSALVAFVNASLAHAALEEGRRRAVVLAGSAVLLLAIAGWGTVRIAEGSLTREGEAIRIGLIQGNIAQEDKWNPAEARRIFTTYLAMTRDAVQRGAELVIWPESATPFMFEEDPVGGAVLRDLAKEVGVPILFGSDQVDRAGDTIRLYNAAFLVSPQGETAAVYRKMHLVPFCEYIPFKQLLYFVSPLVERFAEFAPGASMVMLPVGARMINTAICYEVVYPSLIRDAVLRGSQLLTTITNDGWYGHSSAPYQHFSLASMRAIEQGRYLARAANTGISGIVDPYGRVVQQSGIFEQVGMVDEARLLTGRTIYAAVGDLVAWLALAVTIAAVLPLGRQTARPYAAPVPRAVRRRA